MSLDRLKIHQRSHCELPNSGFWGWLSVESQPQNPAFRNNSENFHPCRPIYLSVWSSLPVANTGFLGWTAKAHISPSAWPWTRHLGASLSLTPTSKISLSWVPIRTLSPRQHTLLTHSPVNTDECMWSDNSSTKLRKKFHTLLWIGISVP